MTVPESGACQAPRGFPQPTSFCSTQEEGATPPSRQTRREWRGRVLWRPHCPELWVLPRQDRDALQRPHCARHSHARGLAAKSLSLPNVTCHSQCRHASVRSLGWRTEARSISCLEGWALFPKLLWQLVLSCGLVLLWSQTNKTDEEQHKSLGQQADRVLLSKPKT